MKKSNLNNSINNHKRNTFFPLIDSNDQSTISGGQPLSGALFSSGRVDTSKPSSCLYGYKG